MDIRERRDAPGISQLPKGLLELEFTCNSATGLSSVHSRAGALAYTELVNNSVARFARKFFFASSPGRCATLQFLCNQARRKLHEELTQKLSSKPCARVLTHSVCVMNENYLLSKDERRQVRKVPKACERHILWGLYGRANPARLSETQNHPLWSLKINRKIKLSWELP